MLRSPTRQARHLSGAELEEVTTALSDLIYLSGKQRTLSHRVVLHASLLSLCDGPRAQGLFDKMKQDRAEFDRVANGLTAGDAKMRIPELAIQLLWSSGKVDRRSVDLMREFQRRSNVLFPSEGAAPPHHVDPDWMLDFADFQPEFQWEEGWQHFEENLVPTAVEWQQVVDRQMIEKVMNAGSHPQKVHVLEHTLTGPMEALQIMAEELAGGGFQVTLFENDHLVVQRSSYLDLEQVSAITGALFRFAYDVGVKYEGWGARVVA